VKTGLRPWIPAFAGMTRRSLFPLPLGGEGEGEGEGLRGLPVLQCSACAIDNSNGSIVVSKLRASSVMQK